MSSVNKKSIGLKVEIHSTWDQLSGGHWTGLFAAVVVVFIVVVNFALLPGRPEDNAFNAEFRELSSKTQQFFLYNFSFLSFFCLLSSYLFTSEERKEKISIVCFMKGFSFLFLLLLFFFSFFFCLLCRFETQRFRFLHFSKSKPANEKELLLNYLYQVLKCLLLLLLFLSRNLCVSFFLRKQEEGSANFCFPYS